MNTLEQHYEKEKSEYNNKENSGNKIPKKLEFTGNWFIDAGILGFVNLMEEVYGWDLDELQRRIEENADIIYYGYFPFAYFYKFSTQDNKEEIKKRFLEFIAENKYKGKTILEDVWWNYITDLFKKTWLNKKLSIMHYSSVLNKKGQVKPDYSDVEYINYLKRREDIINNLIKNFQNRLKEILGKKKELITTTGKHNLSIDDIKSLEKKLNELSPNEDFIKKIKELVEIQHQLKNYLDKLWNRVKDKNIQKEKERFFRIPIDSSFFKNYLFFNNSRGIITQFEDLKNLLDGNSNYSEFLSKIDKTINKFLPSEKEFSNILYTPLQTEMISQNIKFLFIYLINFLNAFISVKFIGNILFYSNDLLFTYKVNKKIKIYLKKKRDTKIDSILRITWKAIVDVITELEVSWSLKDLYLIKFKKLSQQDLTGVEYIGIPKLQASIILDETLRDALNVNLPTPKIEKGYVWIIEEFIKRKPILPYLIEYLKIMLKHQKENKKDKNNKKMKYYLDKNSLIYTATVEAKIKEFEKNEILFTENFFSRYKEILTEIKTHAKYAFVILNVFKSLFASSKDDINLENLANLYLSLLKRNQKYTFVNNVLKTVINKNVNQNQKINLKNIEKVVDFIFNKILLNDISWKNYALVLIISLIYGGEKNGGNQKRST